MVCSFGRRTVVAARGVDGERIGERRNEGTVLSIGDVKKGVAAYGVVVCWRCTAKLPTICWMELGSACLVSCMAVFGTPRYEQRLYWGYSLFNVPKSRFRALRQAFGYLLKWSSLVAKALALGWQRIFLPAVVGVGSIDSTGHKTSCHPLKFAMIVKYTFSRLPVLRAVLVPYRT